MLDTTEQLNNNSNAPLHVCSGSVQTYSQLPHSLNWTSSAWCGTNAPTPAKSFEYPDIFAHQWWFLASLMSVPPLFLHVLKGLQPNNKLSVIMLYILLLVGFLQRDRKKQPEPRASQSHPLHIENSGERTDWEPQLGPGFFRGRMQHLLSSLRHAWVDCAPGCWQQIRNTWVETPVNSVPWNQSSSSGSKEFLDHIGKQINTDLLSCRGDRRGRELPAVCCFSAGKAALKFWCPDYAVHAALASLKGPEDHIAPVLLIMYQSPDSKKSLRAVFTQFPMSRQQKLQEAGPLSVYKIVWLKTCFYFHIKKVTCLHSGGGSAYTAIIFIHRKKTKPPVSSVPSVKSRTNTATQGWLTYQVCPSFPLEEQE